MNLIVSIGLVLVSLLVSILIKSKAVKLLAILSLLAYVLYTGFLEKFVYEKTVTSSPFLLWFANNNSLSLIVILAGIVSLIYLLVKSK